MRTFKDYARSFVSGLALGAVSLLPACATDRNSYERKEIIQALNMKESVPGLYIGRMEDNKTVPFVEFLLGDTVKRYKIFLNGELIEDVEYDPSTHPHAKAFRLDRQPRASNSQLAEIAVEDKNGNQHTWSHNFTAKDLTSGVEYRGPLGEEARSRFHDKTVGALNRLEERYGIKSTVVIADGTKFGLTEVQGTVGFFSRNSQAVSPEAFLYGDGDLDLGIWVLTHEYGHVKYHNEMPVVPDMSDFDGEEIPDMKRVGLPEFMKLYEEAINQGIIDAFKDGIFFEGDDYLAKRLGHPRANSNELYASAFAIHELALDRFRERNYGAFTGEQRNLAEEIFSFVGRSNKR